MKKYTIIDTETGKIINWYSNLATANYRLAELKNENGYHYVIV